MGRYLLDGKSRSVKYWDTPENRIHFWNMRLKVCWAKDAQEISDMKEAIIAFIELHYTGGKYAYTHIGRP